MSVSAAALCVCVFVCFSVRDHTSGPELHVRSSPNCLYMLPMAVARSFSCGVLIRFVFPVYLRLRATGSGERINSPSGSGQSPVAKRILLHFRHKFAPF